MSTNITPSAEIRTLADAIKSHTPAAASTHKSTNETAVDLFITDPAVITETFPEDIDMKSVKAYQAHTRNLVAAATLAAGEIGVEQLKANKKLTAIGLSVKLGDDVIDASVERSRMIGAPGKDKSETFGYTRTKLLVRANKNSGQLKVARTFIGHLATEALA